MILNITLSRGQMMWFLPGGKFHLTEGNPGPVEIDFLSLSKDEQKLIIIGGRNKILELSEHDSALVEIYNGFEQPKQSAVVVPQEENTKTNFTDKDNILKEKLLTLLNKGKGTIKQEIGLMDDIRGLKMILELEMANQNRSKIIDLIHSKLNNIEQGILKEIESTTDSSLELPSTDPVSESMEVVDSELEEREITLDGE